MDPILGSIIMFGGNFAPRGWALCQGQILPIAQNTALFSLLGTTYGGNGQTTFALPDLRGRAPVQQGQGPGLASVDLGEMAGTQTVTILSTQMPAHTHAVQVTLHCANDGRPSSDTPAGSFLDTLPGTNYCAAASDGSVMAAGAASVVVGLAGGSQPVPIQNPFLGINFIIAMEGIFPSRN
jgi:microcystin-dependent protein